MYHVYRNRMNYYWYFIIFFIPLLGCIVYLFIHVFNKKDVKNITEEITTIINPTKKIKDLEKKLQFSNTFQNKINLADAHVEIGDYQNGILIYEKALTGNFKNNPHTINKLIFCYYQVNDYNKVVEYAKKIDLEREFRESNLYLGLSLEKLEEFEEAEKRLQKLDVRYSNYDKRLELGKFLIRRNKIEKAKEILTEISSEINLMSKSNAKKYRAIYFESEKLLNQN